MDAQKFKLGDKVMVSNGQHKGREGYVIKITSQPFGSDVIELRLSPETAHPAKVTPRDLCLAH